MFSGGLKRKVLVGAASAQSSLQMRDAEREDAVGSDVLEFCLASY